MKSLFISLLLTATTANAEVSLEPLFHCDVASKASYAKKWMFQFPSANSKDSSQSANKPATNDLSEFISKTVMHSLVLKSITRNAPLVIEGSSSGFRIQLDMSAVINFSNDLAYGLVPNLAAKDISIANKNSQIVVSASVFQPGTLMPQTFQAADVINENILKQIASQSGAVLLAPNSPKILTEVSFKQLNSGNQKFMRVKLENQDDHALIGVELRGLAGSIQVVNLNGLTTFVYTFHANIGLSQNLNTKDAEQIYDSYNSDISGIYISGANSKNAATVKSLKELGTRVCTDFSFMLEPANSMTVVPFKRN